MVRSSTIFSFLIIMCLQNIVLSQTNRYMVFFTDKASSPYTIDNPIEYLSQKAIDRNNRSVITVEDLPVNPSYILGLKEQGVSVLFTSKWLNGALVESTLSQLEALNLSYVNRFEYVALGTRPTSNGRISDEHGGVLTNGKTELTFNQNEVLHVPKMNADGYIGTGVRVAVLDGGFLGIDNNVYLKHAFTDNRILMTYDLARKSSYVYDYSTHGAEVFSVFGAFVEGSYIGGGYGADFDLFITEDVGSEYRIEEYNWLIAAEKADSAGVDIITTSLGYYDFDDPSMNYDLDDLNGNTAIISQAVDLAFSKGMLVITSVGNEGRETSLWKRITFPADANSVLAVGAVENSNLLKTDFSSPGPTADGRIKPDVMAIGGGTTYINSTSVIATGNGTSYAAPLITGLAVGLWQKYPALSNIELKELIIQSGDNYDNPDNSYGYGVPNYTRASNIQEGILTGLDLYKDEHMLIFPNPSKNGFINVELREKSAEMSLEIINMHGQIVKKQTIMNANHFTIDVSGINKGLYFVKVRSMKSVKQESVVIE